MDKYVINTPPGMEMVVEKKEGLTVIDFKVIDGKVGDLSNVIDMIVDYNVDHCLGHYIDAAGILDECDDDSIMTWNQSSEVKAKARRLRDIWERLADVLNGGWKPNWEDNNEMKYFVYLDRELKYSTYSSFNTGIAVFKSEALLEKARKLFGDDNLIFMLKYL